MIILEQINRIVEETLKEQIQKKKEGGQVGIKMTCADFDGVVFDIATSKDKPNELTVSIATKCTQVLNKYGCQQKLKAIYGPHLQAQAISGFDYTLCLNLDELPEKPLDLCRRFALLKRHMFASPFDYVFNSYDQGKPVNEILDIPYRGDERIFIKPEGKDKVTVVYAINFLDPDDVIIGKVFLSEFKKSISGAPSVDFSHRDPPGELSSIRNLPNKNQNFSYVTMALFERHFTKETRNKTIDMSIIFRNYLHYHIKCSKSHLHTRMRIRVDDLLKILNRAKQELPKEKKTVGGRTFVRK